MEASVKPKAAAGQSWPNWTTPQVVLDRVARVRAIALDPCSNERSIVRSHRCIMPPQDGLAMDWTSMAWDGLVFVNPPYNETGKWLEKARLESVAGAEVIALVPASTGTKWFQAAVARADALLLWGPGRIQFGNPPPGAPGNRPSIESALIYWGPRSHRFLDAFSGAGLGVRL